MSTFDTLDFIIQLTDNTTLVWEEAAKLQIPPASVVQKIDGAMLDWMRELTKTLRLWTDKGSSMTSGELILARANLGSVVESWLKVFYCVFKEDYDANPKIDKRTGKAIEPNNLTFEELKQFSRNILYNPKGAWDRWIESVQLKRNAIHSFNYREIGSVPDFYDDVEKLYSFIQLITDRFPPVEDYIQTYPKGYSKPYLAHSMKQITRR